MNKSARIVAKGGTHQIGWADAFAEGLKRHGWQTEIQGDYDPADLIVLWGVNKQDVIKRAKADGGGVCILERGYVGDRFAYTSVSFGGGLNNRGTFYGPFDDPSRWERHFAHLMRGWHVPDGGYALIMGQVAEDNAVKHVNIGQWYQVQAAALQNAGWTVKFRPHPNRPETHTGLGSRVQRIGGDLETALEGAGLVVTFNSNSGVDAALYGRPVIAMDRGSMAYEVSGHEVSEIIMPDRTTWAHALAWKQFSLAEMQSGVCQEVVGLCSN